MALVTAGPAGTRALAAGSSHPVLEAIGRVARAEWERTEPGSPERLRATINLAALERAGWGRLSEPTAQGLQAIVDEAAGDPNMRDAAGFLLLADRLKQAADRPEADVSALLADADAYLNMRSGGAAELRYLKLALLAGRDSAAALRVFEELAAAHAESAWFARADRLLVEAGVKTERDPRVEAAREGRLEAMLRNGETADGAALLKAIQRREGEPGYTRRRTWTVSQKQVTTRNVEYLQIAADGTRLRRSEAVREYQSKKNPDVSHHYHTLSVSRGGETWKLFNDAKVAIKRPDPSREPVAQELLESPLVTEAFGALLKGDPSKLQDGYTIESASMNERSYVLVTRTMSEQVRKFIATEGKSFAVKMMKEAWKGEDKPPWALRVFIRTVLPFIDLRKHMTVKREYWIDRESLAIVREIHYDDYDEVRSTTEYGDVVTEITLPPEFFVVPDDYEVRTPEDYGEMRKMEKPYRKSLRVVKEEPR